MTPGVTVNEMDKTPPKSGAPREEQNGTNTICRLALPSLGKPHLGIKRRMLAFRKHFEGELMRLYGSVSPWQGKVLRTACKAFVASMRVDRVLLQAGDPGHVAQAEAVKDQSKARIQTGLTHAEYQGYLDRSLRYEAECDRALRSIGLDRKEDDDSVDRFYREQAARQRQLAAAHQQTNATQTGQEAVSGNISRPGANGAISDQTGNVPPIPAPQT